MKKKSKIIRKRYILIQEKIYAFVLKKIEKQAKKCGIYYDIQEEMAESDRFWTSSFDELYNFIGRDNVKVLKGCDLLEALAILGEACEQVYLNITDYFGNSWNFAPGWKPENVKLPADLPGLTEPALLKLYRTL